MLDAFLKQLPRVTLAVAIVVPLIVVLNVAMGSTWEGALSEVDVSHWLFYIVSLSLFTGWMRERKESAA